MELAARPRLEEHRPYDEIVRNMCYPRRRIPQQGGASSLARRGEATDARSDAMGHALPRAANPRPLLEQEFQSHPEVVGQEISYAFLGMKLEVPSATNIHSTSGLRKTSGASRGFLHANPVQRAARPPVAGQVQVREVAKNCTSPSRAMLGSGGVIQGRTRALAAHARRQGLSRIPSTTIHGPLAAWMTAADNPYFARALVDRIWAHHLGRGFSTDRFSQRGQPPSHPQLLDALTKDFVEHRFDLEASAPDDSQFACLPAQWLRPVPATPTTNATIPITIVKRFTPRY